MRIATGFIAIVCTLVSATAFASLAGDINRLRAKGCNGHAGVSTPLRQTRELDAVAQEWSRGGRLRDALQRSNYRALNSASMHIEGAPDDAALTQALAGNYCGTLTDPGFTAIGIAGSRKDLYVVVALPFTAPGVRDVQRISSEVLTLVNKARTTPRRCGSQNFPATTPLALSASLSEAALIHAQDMSTHNFFEHEGSDGSTPAVRVTRVGYVWKTVGENIAAGPTTAAAVVNGWLDSPGHCANIMAPQFREMGIAYASNSKSDAGIYWSQEFGTRR